MRVTCLLMSTAAMAFASPLMANPAPGRPQAVEPLPAPVPVEEWSLDKVSRLGREIYRYDRAAWLASDVLTALPDKSAFSTLRGWIVVPDGDALKVRFISEGDGGVFRAGWDVRVDNRGAGPMTVAPDEPLPADQLAMFKARLTAANNIGRLRCSQRLNTVVIKDPDSDGWLVWLLTSTNDAAIVPVGGHYRFTISADGASVVRRDMLSNSCLPMPKGPPRGAQPAGLVVSQIVSSGPVETHVFLSLQNRIPIYVSAGNKLFAVEGDRIRDASAALNR